MKILILSTLLTLSLPALSQENQICGHVQGINLAGNKVLVKLDNVSKSYFIEAAGASTVLAIAKSQSMTVCLSHFYAKGDEANDQKNFAANLSF